MELKLWPRLIFKVCCCVVNHIKIAYMCWCVVKLRYYLQIMLLLRFDFSKDWLEVYDDESSVMIAEHSLYSVNYVGAAEVNLGEVVDAVYSLPVL